MPMTKALHDGNLTIQQRYKQSIAELQRACEDKDRRIVEQERLIEAEQQGRLLHESLEANWRGKAQEARKRVIELEDDMRQIIDKLEQEIRRLNLLIKETCQYESTPCLDMPYYRELEGRRNGMVFAIQVVKEVRT